MSNLITNPLILRFFLTKLKICRRLNIFNFTVGRFTNHLIFKILIKSKLNKFWMNEREVD
jgi:hypothetical protein